MGVELMTTLFTWLGIVFCISQSACFSGLNLAFFSLSRLQLEILAGDGDERGAAGERASDPAGGLERNGEIG